MKKSIFLHQVPAIAGGKPQAIAQLLQGAGFNRVEVKIADARAAYTPNRLNWPTWGLNVKPELVTALRAAGIEVWGWSFLYGNYPADEGHIAASETVRLGLTGLVLDVETAFERQANLVSKSHAAGAAARKILRADFPLAFCSWALWNSPVSGTRWHPSEMAKAFMEYCNIGMPMIYWSGYRPQDALYQLEHSLKQWGAITRSPIIPVGRAYDGDGGTAKQEAMFAFSEQIAKLGLPGCSWWSLDYAHKRIHWDWLQGCNQIFDRLGPAPKPQPDPITPPIMEIPAAPKVKLAAGKTSLRIRSAPIIAAGNIVGTLGPSDRPKVLGAHLEGNNVWLELGWQQYAAMLHNGTLYLEWANE